MKVCKFGGSSLADAARVSAVCDIVLADPDRRLVVVSAPGKRHDGDRKVTDLLIDCAQARQNGRGADDPRHAVLARFTAIQQDLGLEAALIDRIRDLLDKRLAADITDPGRFLDGVQSLGEQFNAWMVAAALRKRGCPAEAADPAEAGMLLTPEFGQARLIPTAYTHLAALRDRPGITIFPGFFGVTPDGHIATFSRGGSDITGSILAVAVGAEEYENFTDVDNVYAVDPRLVPERRHAIAELTYREMRELAYAGFGVFHDEALAPVFRAHIPIRIRNTARPDLPGTRIVPTRTPVHGSVVGIASADGFCCLYVDKYLMNREIGFSRRLFQILEESGISYEHAPSGIDNLSVVFRNTRMDGEKEVLVLERIRRELEPDAILFERDHAMIMVVGEGLQYTVGMAAKASAALAAAGVNIEMINQGASEISIMFGVRSADRERAVRALAAAFFPEPPVETAE